MINRTTAVNMVINDFTSKWFNLLSDNITENLYKSVDYVLSTNSVEYRKSNKTTFDIVFKMSYDGIKKLYNL